MEKKINNKKTFEESIKRLEEIVAKLESGEVPLEETINLFQEGIELVNFCNKKLEEVKHKVEIVIRNKNGFTLKPFDTKVFSENDKEKDNSYYSKDNSYLENEIEEREEDDGTTQSPF